MSSRDTFKKVGMSEETMYGPPKVLACGHTPAAQHILIELFRTHGLGHFPIVFIPEAEEDRCLKEFLQREHCSGFGKKAGNIPALIVSGFTEKELHALLAAYRTRGGTRPLLATLTPTSETWTIEFLLKELRREAEAMKGVRQNGVTPPE